MYSPRWISGLLSGLMLGLLLSGCANFGAISEFSHQTGKLTEATAAELDFISQDCAKVARTRRIVDDVPEAAAGCAGLKRAVTELAANTNDVLAAWGQILGALADGKQFDYASSLGKTGRALKALKNGDGASAVDSSIANTGLAVIDLILKASTEAQRRDAVVQILARADDARVLARHLQSVFVSPAPEQSPYTLQMAVDAGGLESSLASLDAMASREPIRVREWQDTIRAHQATLEKRASGDVARATGAAIEHWLRALDVLTARAFEPDAREWRDQFGALKSRVDAVRDALQTSGSEKP